MLIKYMMLTYRHMGNCFVEVPKYKQGDLYTNIKSQLRPFDLLIFRGDEFVSNSISKLQKRGKPSAKAGDFTHTGMVVTSEILNIPEILPDKIYILESVMSGSLGYGIKNIYDRTFFGVQIRDFDILAYAYDIPNATSIAWCKLLHNPLDVMPIEEAKQRFSAIYNDVNGKMYDANCCSLLAALYPCMRPWRTCTEQAFDIDDWYMCSELVAYVYQKMNILPSEINYKDVVPGDFVHPEEDTDKMPLVVHKPVYMTTPLHYNTEMPPNNIITI